LQCNFYQGINLRYLTGKLRPFLCVISALVSLSVIFNVAAFIADGTKVRLRDSLAILFTYDLYSNLDEYAILSDDENIVITAGTTALTV